MKLFYASLLILASSVLHAKDMKADIEQIDYYDGNQLRFVAGTNHYTYPSGQLSRFVLAFTVKDTVIKNNVLDKGVVTFSFLQRSPDGDNQNDGLQQVHCREISIIDLLNAWIKKHGLNGYNKFHIQVALPPLNLRMNPEWNPWPCKKYEAPEVNLD